MATSARPKNLRGPQLLAACNEAAGGRMARVHAMAVDPVDVKGETRIVTRLAAVGSTCNRGEAEAVTLVGQGQECAQHAHVKVGPAARRPAVVTAPGHHATRGLLEVVLCGGGIAAAADLEVEGVHSRVREKLRSEAGPLPGFVLGLRVSEEEKLAQDQDQGGYGEETHGRRGAGG